MKKLILTVLALTLTTSAMAQVNPGVLCNQYRSMQAKDVYELGYNVGVGYCWIINNGGYYGVMHTNRGQISPTYHSPYSFGTYNPKEYTAATGLVQLICNMACFRAWK